MYQSIYIHIYLMGCSPTQDASHHKSSPNLTVHPTGLGIFCRFLQLLRSQGSNLLGGLKDSCWQHVFHNGIPMKLHFPSKTLLEIQETCLAMKKKSIAVLKEFECIVGCVPKQ